MKNFMVLLLSLFGLCSLANAQGFTKDSCLDQDRFRVNCGLSGSIEERIADCKKKRKYSNRYPLDLVTNVWVPFRNPDGSIKYCDERRIYQNGLKMLWVTTDRSTDQASAVNHCLDQTYGPSSWPVGMKLKWRLPTSKEMAYGCKDPNSAEKKFWTSTTQRHPDGAVSAALCDVDEGIYSVWTAWTKAGVQCTARVL